MQNTSATMNFQAQQPELPEVSAGNGILSGAILHGQQLPEAQAATTHFRLQVKLFLYLTLIKKRGITTVWQAVPGNIT